MGRRGFFVSTADPDELVLEEPCAVLDFARQRAAKISARRSGRIYVWDWNPENGLRRVRSAALAGRVYWYRECGGCRGFGAGCEACHSYGSVVDPSAPVERAGDAI